MRVTKCESIYGIVSRTLLDLSFGKFYRRLILLFRDANAWSIQLGYSEITLRGRSVATTRVQFH